MHVSSKRIAFSGLLLAFTVILVILSGILEFNTLFLLAAASFLVGVSIRENGIRYGFGFLIASILLSFILAPNKIYCITFSAFSFYIFVMEYTWEKLANLNSLKNRTVLYWAIKYITFNIMYLLILFILPKLVYEGTINTKIYLLLLVSGQIGIFIFDYAYRYFQKEIWNKLRQKLRLIENE